MSTVSLRTRASRSHLSKTRAGLESLESRVLLSAVVGSSPDAVAVPWGITHDTAGNLYVTDFQGTIDKLTVDATGNVISSTAFNAGGTESGGFITFNPTNNHLYFNDNQGDIGEMDTDGNVLNLFAIPDAQDHNPVLLTTAADGSIWFAAQSFDGTHGSIVRMDTAGNFTEQDFNVAGSAPVAVAASADGSVWVGVGGAFTGSGFGNSSIAQATYNPSTGISYTNYAIPSSSNYVSGITVAADNSVWFTEQDANGTGVADTIGHGVLTGSSMAITEFVIPKAAGESPDLPTSPHIDNAGNLWFAENGFISMLNTTSLAFTRLATGDTGASSADLTVTNNGVYMTTLNGNSSLEQVNLTGFASPVSSGTPDIAATVGQPFSGPVAMFSSDQPGDFSYTLNYGNGNVDTGTIPFDSSGMYTVNGSQTYAAVGSYNTVLTITDAAGDVLTFNGTATVTSGVVATGPFKGNGKNLKGPEQVALAPNVAGVATLVVAKFTGPVATYTATINWGDGTSSAGVIVQTGTKQYYVKLADGDSKTYASQGTYNVSVVITDGNRSITTTSVAKIGDTPLVVSKGLVLSSVGATVPLSTVATFTDDLTSNINWFSAMITWGDGTTSAGIIVRTSAGHYAVLGLHTYTQKGNYAVKTLVDNLVEDVTATATAKVIIPKIV